MNDKSKRTIGVSAFIIGTILLVFIGILSIWSEIEASFFDAALRSKEPLTTLRCPAVITPNGQSFVRGSFTNPDDEPIDLQIRTYITNGYVTLMTEFIRNISLNPGETKTVEIPVYVEDAAYGRLVLVRMHQMKRVPLPYLNGSCGIVVFDLPWISGTQFITLSLSLGAIFTTGGLVYWAINAKPIVWDRKRQFVAMMIFAIISFVLTIASLLNWWLLGVLLTVIWILMGVGMIWQFATTPRKDREREIQLDKEHRNIS